MAQTRASCGIPRGRSVQSWPRRSSATSSRRASPSSRRGVGDGKARCFGVHGLSLPAVLTPVGAARQRQASVARLPEVQVPILGPPQARQIGADVSSAPAGATVRLHTDWQGPPDDPPTPGDYLVTEGRRGYGSAYLLDHVRLQTRAAKPNSYALRCVKLAGVDDVPDDARVIVMRWHPRNRRRPR